MYTTVLTYVYEGVDGIFKLDTTGAHEESMMVSMPTQVHVILGSTLSFLVVFRTNTAYSKWADARQAWGVISTTSRAIAARLPGVVNPERVLTGANVARSLSA